VPPWAQVVAVVGSFVATVLLTNTEYRAHGTSFGFPGAAYNALVCPIYEELIFRGWVLGRLRRWRSAPMAIVVSSLLSGLFHLRDVFWMDPLRLARTMATTGLLLGPLLALVTLRCRSVWPAVILHDMNNLTYFLR